MVEGYSIIDAKTRGSTSMAGDRRERRIFEFLPRQRNLWVIETSRGGREAQVAEPVAGQISHSGVTTPTGFIIPKLASPKGQTPQSDSAGVTRELTPAESEAVAVWRDIEARVGPRVDLY